MIMTYEEVCGNAWSIGENSSFSSWLSGELVLILPMKGSYLLNGEFSSQLTLGGGGGWLPLCLGPAGESSHDILYWGFG